MRRGPASPGPAPSEGEAAPRSSSSRSSATRFQFVKSCKGVLAVDLARSEHVATLVICETRATIASCPGLAAGAGGQIPPGGGAHVADQGFFWVRPDVVEAPFTDVAHGEPHREARIDEPMGRDRG